MHSKSEMVVRKECFRRRAVCLIYRTEVSYCRADALHMLFLDSAKMDQNIIGYMAEDVRRLFLMVFVIPASGSAFAADPLKDRNDGPAKQSIVTFVTKVAAAGSLG
jgi:hypothetical protein